MIIHVLAYLTLFGFAGIFAFGLGILVLELWP